MSRGFPKRSFSFIDGMALFRKVKCAGLSFDKVAKEIFNAARTYTSWSKRILFSISTRTSVQQRKLQGAKDVQTSCLSRKSSEQWNNSQWDFFSGGYENKNSRNQFLVSSLRNTMPTNKVTYANIGKKCFSLNDSGTINYLFCKQEETFTVMFLYSKHISSNFC